MPPESILYNRFAEDSDVWSYGVTLWEIYSYGLQPYHGYSNAEVIELVRNRTLLEIPEFCPPRVYSLIVECWSEVPSRRPRFAEIFNRLQTWSVVSSPVPSSVTPTSRHSSTTGPGGLPPPPPMTGLGSHAI